MSCPSIGRHLRREIFLERLGVECSGLAVNFLMVPLDMLGQLVLPVVSNWAVRTSVGFVIGVSSLMIVPISDGSELLVAELTAVGSLTGMNSVMNLKISSFIERLFAKPTIEEFLRLLDLLSSTVDVLPVVSPLGSPLVDSWINFLNSNSVSFNHFG